MDTEHSTAPDEGDETVTVDGSAGATAPAADEGDEAPSDATADVTAGDEVDTDSVSDAAPTADAPATDDGNGRPAPGHSAWDALSDAERAAADPAAQVVLSQRAAAAHQ